MKRVLLFCILLMCLVSPAHTASYDSGTDTVSVSGSETLSDLVTAVNDANKFSGSGNNYTSNVSAINVGSGTLTLTDEQLYWKSNGTFYPQLNTGSGSTIILNSTITAINTSRRWRISGVPTNFIVNDSILEHYHNITFNGYREGNNWQSTDSTFRYYYNMIFYEEMHFTECDISKFENYAMQQCGNLIDTVIHSNVEGSDVLQYHDHEANLIDNVTFRDLTNVGGVLFLKERQNYTEIVNCTFENITGNDARLISLYKNNFVYTDPEPMWIHNNTFNNNTGTALFLYQSSKFIFENNTINDQTTGFGIIGNAWSNNGTSYFRNNMISNSTIGLYLYSYTLSNMKFQNVTYYNVDTPINSRDVDRSGLTIENETYTNCGDSLITRNTTIKLTNPNGIIPFGAGYTTGGWLKHLKDAITLKTHFYITINRTEYSPSLTSTTWTDVKTYEVDNLAPTYEISGLTANQNYSIYKDDVLLGYNDSGVDGTVQFQTLLDYSPGNVFIINTTLLSGMRYNSETPFINTIDESGTVTGYSRTLNPDTDSSSNLRVVPQ